VSVRDKIETKNRNNGSRNKGKGVARVKSFFIRVIEFDHFGAGGGIATGVR
jgi:hypothetical protein